MTGVDHGSGPIELKGVPASPYTRKMVALLRYRHIPYRWHIGNQLSADRRPQPKVALLPMFYLPDAAGEMVAVVDSTPIVRRLEAMFPQRSVLAPDPALDFLNYLLEDFADEWLSKAMFHYRWRYQGGATSPISTARRPYCRFRSSSTCRHRITRRPPASFPGARSIACTWLARTMSPLP